MWVSQTLGMALHVIFAAISAAAGAVNDYLGGK